MSIFNVFSSLYKKLVSETKLVISVKDTTNFLSTRSNVYISEGRNLINSSKKDYKIWILNSNCTMILIKSTYISFSSIFIFFSAFEF